MSNALRRRLASVLVLWALVFSGFLVAASAARADAPAVPAVNAQTSIPVTHSRDSLNTPTSAQGDNRLQNALDKMDPSLQPIALNRQKGYSDVLVYTTNMPELATALQKVGARIAYMVDDKSRVERFVARPWGTHGQMVSINVQIPGPSLIDVASLDGVAYIQERAQYAPAIIRDQVTAEEQGQFNTVKDEIRAGTFTFPPRISSMKGGGSVSPTSWAIAREHKALDVWRDLGYQGGGVNVAVIDTGEDFGNPSLQGQWAVDTNPASRYFGWPIMFHPASMEGLMGNGWWTAASDLDRLPIPFWLSANDGDSWYSNTDYRANDSNLDGFLVYRQGTPDPVTGFPQYTPRVNPQQYGNFGGNFNTRINRNYWVGLPTDPSPPHIVSASGIYHLGVARDDTLTGLYGEKVGILLVDSTTPFIYDTVYVDLNFDFDFTDDKPVTRASPLAIADLNGDGISDVSGGLLYFISSSTSVTGETVIDPIQGTETGATLANSDVAVDITGWFDFKAPTQLWLERIAPPAAPSYFPGATEDIYEEFTAGAANENGTTWALGSAQTTFGPRTITPTFFVTGFVTGGSPDTATLIRTMNFPVSLVYDVEDCDATFTTCTALTAADYSINTATGTITWARDLVDTDVVSIIYQLDTYTLEPVSGDLTFNHALPTNHRLLADYDTGLPIPYSDIYGLAHGYDTFIPANGDLVAFHGDFDNGQTHGSFVSSTIAARPFGNLASPFFEVFGTAPRAKIIGIAACCNAAGPIGLFGSIEDQRDFAAVGYDGLPNTGDEASIISNSFGSTQTVNTGFSFEDRWLYDFTQRNPTVTTLIAFGNNGAGYATGAPGGTSPGVVTIGAGTSGDYRVQINADAGEGNYESPFCPGPPPIDPATCIGVGAASGDGPGPYGEHAYFSSRGPTLLGQPKPDVVSIGSFAVEAAPLNAYCTNPFTGRQEPVWCNGNLAFDIFSGTSQATPVTSGIAALGVEAYRATHGGANPTNTQVKTALKAGADDMHRDILQQGAGWTDALRTAKIMAELDGITPSVHFWIPGSYQGVKRPAFVNLLSAGSSDAATITITNHHPTLAKTVAISDAVYQRMSCTPPAQNQCVFSWPVSLGTGTARNYILKADGIYAGDGATLLMAEPWTTPWATADFTKITWTYDSTAFTGPTSLRLDIFDWYDYAHPVGFPLGTYNAGTDEFVAEATLTNYTGRVVATGTNGETKGTLYNPATQALTSAAWTFSRDSFGVMTDITPVPCGLFVDPSTYWIDTVAGKIVLCAPLADGEKVTGDYQIYDLVLAGDSVFLANTGIVVGSETVYLNGVPWPAANFVIDYPTGELTFNTDLAPGDLVQIDYAWDHPGIYDGKSERNRMTVAVFGGNANSVHESFGQLPTKIHNGLVLNIRSGASAAIPATLIVEFYQKVDWGWLSEGTPPVTRIIAAAGGTASFPVTATVPAGAQPGLYEGAIYLTESGVTTTIPVVINVPVTGFPVSLGGNVPTTSLYDNNGIIQGARSGWRQIGDSRYVWANLSVGSAPGRQMIFNAILQGQLSDPDMLLFSCTADPDGYTLDATYGPCRMTQLAKTKENVGATDTLFPNREFMTSSVVSGLIAFQLKAYGSRGSYSNGTEPLIANIGIMQATLNGPGNPLGATEVSTSTNKLVSSVPLTIWADVPLVNGLGAAVTESVSTQCATNMPVTPYGYPGGDFVTYLFNAPNKARCDIAANTISAAWSAQYFNGNDVDYGIFKDTNCDGVYTVADIFSGTSMATSANPETFAAGFPPAGCYWVHAAGFDASPSTTTTITMNVNRIGTSPFALVSPPTTDVPANTPISTAVGWTFPNNQAQGVVNGQLFVSPGYAPFALAIGLTLAVRYDTTPVTIQDFAPVPGSTTADAYPSVVANVFDTTVRQINIDTARLWVDGAEVTQSMRKLPTFASPVACCYNLLTVTYDPPTRLADGPHSAILEVQDIAGNLGRATWSWVVDSTPPVISLTSPVGNGATATAAVTVSGYAPTAATVTVNGASVAVDSITGWFTTGLTLVSGSNTIDVVATDAVGNTATVTRTWTLDTVGPTLLNVRSSEPSKTNRDSTVISGTVGETVASLTVAGLAVPVRDDGSFAVRLSLVEGTNTFAVAATDLAGNPAMVPVVVTRDTVAPAIELQAITPAVITNLNQRTVNVTGTVGGTDVSLVTVNGIAVPATGGTFRREFTLSLGSNVFVVEAQDDVGNRATATTSVTYSPVLIEQQRSYTSYILGSVAVVLLIVGFLVGWMLKGTRGPPTPPPMVEMPPPPSPPMEEKAPPAPEEMPAEEEMTTEEEEL